MDRWDGTALSGVWLVTRKIDGVNLDIRGGVATTRGGTTPVWRVDVPDGIYELYEGAWTQSMTALRISVPPLPTSLYLLDPDLDPRLVVEEVEDPTVADIMDYFDMVRQEGYEGLVLWGPGGPLKVKLAETYDAVVTGFTEGKGRLAGSMGSVETSMGAVGVGFTHSERAWWWASREALLGVMIEVVSHGLTPNGKFREPRFLRFRPDKQEVCDCIDT